MRELPCLDVPIIIETLPCLRLALYQLRKHTTKYHSAEEQNTLLNFKKVSPLAVCQCFTVSIRINHGLPSRCAGLPQRNNVAWLTTQSELADNRWWKLISISSRWAADRLEFMEGECRGRLPTKRYRRSERVPCNRAGAGLKKRINLLCIRKSQCASAVSLSDYETTGIR